MRFMLAVFGVMLGLSSIACGQEPQVDRAEVLRLGNLVQHVDGIRADPEDAFVQAMSPPASDADKWFISVLSMRGCSACQRLKSDWEKNARLLALGDPGNPQRSWAHYNVYYREDRSQAFRFETLRVTAFPTIVVQPPRSGRYGDAATVVLQTTYGGDPDRLAEQITAAIRLYVLKRSTEGGTQQAAPLGIDPPWEPAPQNEPLSPNAPIFPDGRPLVPPNLELISPSGSLINTAKTVAASVIATLLAALGGPWLFKTVRAWRTARTEQANQTQVQLQQLLEVLRAKNDNANSPSDNSKSQTT